MAAESITLDRWKRLALMSKRHRAPLFLVFGVFLVAVGAFAAAGLGWRALYEAIAMYLCASDPALTADADTGLRQFIWFLRVAAPLSLAGVVGDVLGAFVGGDAGEAKDHVIVVGAGRLGTDLARWLNKKKVPVVVIDKQPSANLEMLAAHGVDVVMGDARLEETLKLAGYGAARGLVAVTGSDAVNLSCAALFSEHTARESYPQVSRPLIRDHFGKAPHVTPFDRYTIAADAIVAAYLEEIEGKQGAIIGFGRLGQALFDALQARGWTMRALDRAGQACGEHVGTCDLNDPAAVWREIPKDTTVFVCTDDDDANLGYAAQLCELEEEALVCARFFHWPLPEPTGAKTPSSGVIKLCVSRLLHDRLTQDKLKGLLV